jgi:transposase
MFQIVLDVPHVRVVDVTRTKRGEWVLCVESTLSSTTCARCGLRTEALRGCGERVRLRHLPVFERPVFLEVRPKRFACTACEGEPVTTQRLDWYDGRGPNTRAFDEWAARLDGATGWAGGDPEGASEVLHHV